MNDLTLLFLCTTLLLLYTTWTSWTRAEAYRDLWKESMQCWDKCFERGEQRLDQMRYERDLAHERLRKIDPEYPNSF